MSKMTRVVLQMMGLATAATLAVLLIFHLVVNVFFTEEFQASFQSSSRLGKFKTAAVSSDGVPCSKVGR